MGKRVSLHPRFYWERVTIFRGIPPCILVVQVFRTCWLLMPLVAFLLVVLLPLDVYVKRVFYIIACCPTASIVLNFAEILGEGQEEAAGTVLLGTALSAVTLPLMTLLLPFL